MMNETLELPFRQAMWIMYKLRQAEIKYDEHGSYNNRGKVNYWRKKADSIMEKMGINETTDFKTMEIKFI